MFTGIVQEVGTVLDTRQTDTGLLLQVETTNSFLEELEIGASISVNGVCLTVVKFSKKISDKTKKMY